MNKSICTLLLILLLVLVIVAASIFILRGTPSDREDPRSQTTVTPAPPRETAAPGQETAPASGTAAPVSTREPLETAPPAETPAPTPEPTPEPTPAPADASGRFTSDTGTGLNLKVDWKTYTAADGKRKLQADVSIVSYSIFSSSQYKSITLKIGGNSWSADCPGVSYDGKDQIVTKAATFTVDAPAPGTAVSVEWYYGGKYSGKELNTITATGTIK